MCNVYQMNEVLGVVWYLILRNIVYNSDVRLYVCTAVVTDSINYVQLW